MVEISQSAMGKKQARSLKVDWGSWEGGGGGGQKFPAIHGPSPSAHGSHGRPPWSAFLLVPGINSGGLLFAPLPGLLLLKLMPGTGYLSIWDIGTFLLGFVAFN
jgi:hypothetical protein